MKRIWIFPFQETLSMVQRESVILDVRNFVDTWTAHKVAVSGAVRLIEDRFLCLIADQAVTGVSGCSIDAMFRAVQNIASKHGLKVADASVIHYRSPFGIQSVSRPDFKKLIQEGKVSGETRVFDPTLQNLQQLEDEKFECCAKDSWHKSFFS